MCVSLHEKLALSHSQDDSSEQDEEPVHAPSVLFEESDQDELEIDQTALYDEVSQLSQENALKHLCMKIQGLMDQSNTLDHSIKEDEEHLTCLQPGTTLFTYRQNYRYLAWNSSGTLSNITRPNRSQKTSLPGSTKNVIEVVSFVAGVGQRRQTINNSTKRMNLGSIGLHGFALARGKLFTTFLKKSDLSDHSTHFVECSSLSEDEEFTDSTPIEPDDDQQDNDESILEYHPFSTWGAISKAWWSKTLTSPEKITHLAVGDFFVAILTTTHYLHIFTCSGLSLLTFHLNGSPVALIAKCSFLLVVTLTISSKRLKSYKFRLFEVSIPVEHLSENFNAIAPRRIVWIGLSSIFYPLLIDDIGCAFALFPTYHSSREAAQKFKWISVLELRNFLLPFQSHELMSEQENSSVCILDYLWIASVEQQHIDVFRITPHHPQPPLNTFKLHSLPLRFTPLWETLSTPMTYTEWMDYLKSDPEFKDLTKLASLPWEFFEEIRCRAKAMLAQMEWIIKAKSLNEEGSAVIQKIKKLIQKEVVKMDKASFRIFIKAFGEGKMERCFDTAKQFYHMKTFEIALAHAEARGNKSLCEKLRSEMECRTMKKNSTLVRHQLQVLDASDSLDYCAPLYEKVSHKRSQPSPSGRIADQLLRNAKII